MIAQSARQEPGTRDCPACNQSGQAVSRLPNYDFEEWRLGACRTCRFVFLLNPPETEALVDELAFEKIVPGTKGEAPQPAARRRSLGKKAAWRAQAEKFKLGGSILSNREGA